MVFMDPNEFLHSDAAISMDKYYMNIAMAVRRKANCIGRKVGAILGSAVFIKLAFTHKL
jgi:deoxycytidylate deaminase